MEEEVKNFLKFEILATPLKVLLRMTLGCDLDRAAIQRTIPSHLSSRLLGSPVEPQGPLILRPAIFVTERKMNSDQALFLGVFATFIVSECSSRVALLLFHP
ncbi:unnamed protein product [Brassica oleracea]|uniref:Uncharacterized protein n=1 Tax=Brassica oleracea TaxID=3712 RepID=A0A3P6DQK2_BRAOL|nr:unnamed protein product [Brassica oleracea]